MVAIVNPMPDVVLLLLGLPGLGEEGATSVLSLVGWPSLSVSVSSELRILPLIKGKRS